MIKFIKEKLDKNLGFILEAAIEAFPQSLLQIVAIVYYQEANYVSIISILLSMFSVMSKSLVISQGIDKSTFIWTWLCLVTDFFGIFFTCTWVFYSNDNIPGEYFGYFNIFGQIWFWKFGISTLLPVGVTVTLGFLTVVPFFACAFMFDPDFQNDSLVKRCGWLFLLLIFGVYYFSMHHTNRQVLQYTHINAYVYSSDHCMFGCFWCMSCCRGLQLFYICIICLYCVYQKNWILSK